MFVLESYLWSVERPHALKSGFRPGAGERQNIWVIQVIRTWLVQLTVLVVPFRMNFLAVLHPPAVPRPVPAAFPWCWARMLGGRNCGSPLLGASRVGPNSPSSRNRLSVRSGTDRSVVCVGLF